VLGVFTVVRKRVGNVARDGFIDAAERKVREVFGDQPFQTAYAVMGHTHRPAVLEIAVPGRRGFYINTGTWIQPLSDGIRCGYQRFSRKNGEYSHEPLVPEATLLDDLLSK
jgi:hypothetical protein